VTVTATNSVNAHSVALSIQGTMTFATATFSPMSGSTPLKSTLKIVVPNSTKADTYTITIVATSQDISAPATATTTLQMYVQQNTHTITVDVEGLPSKVVTPFYLDSNMLTNLGSGVQILSISNKTHVISVQQQIASGDTLYSCQVYTQAADTGVNSFTFTYTTQYRLVISGDLPQTMVSNLTLLVNGTDKSPTNFKPSKGYDAFVNANSQVSFAITPSLITSSDVNYEFRDWKDLSTGAVLGPSNSTTDTLYSITMTRPYYFEAFYDQMVMVTIKTNLPSDMSNALQIGLVGSDLKSVNVTGSVPFLAGEFLVGSTFQTVVGQDQLVLFNALKDVRYEFQGITPASPTTLTKHTTIMINYAVKYRVQVSSDFPNAILQPAGGVEWLSPGEIATLQVKNNANDKNNIPYVFEQWTGSISSNKTTVNFPVTAPVDEEAVWRIDWMYLLTLGGGFVVVAAPTALVVKKKVLVKGVKWGKNKVPPRKQEEASENGLTNLDMKVYNYIIAKGGTLKLSEATNELEVSREELNQSILKLKDSGLLH